MINFDPAKQLPDKAVLQPSFWFSLDPFPIFKILIQID